MRKFLIEWEESGEAKSLVMEADTVNDLIDKAYHSIKSGSCTVTPLYDVSMGEDGGLELK